MSQFAYGIDDRHLVFRLRTARDDMASVTLIYGDRFCRKTPAESYRCPMRKILFDSLFDWWEITVETEYKRVFYGFELTGRDGSTLFYSADRFHEALTEDPKDFYQLPFNHRADRAVVPAWMRDAVIYNIFPDSFATGKRFITGSPSEMDISGKTIHGNNGGTIRGITENLDYIQSLGANCIYLNPIFTAGEYHKYDLIDYYHIDPLFGTDADFRELVETAHQMGIRVILDGVFNHCGWQFFAFQDVLKSGKDSPYWKWFFRLEEPVIIPDNEIDYPSYECFAYVGIMPKLALDEPEVQEYFCQVGEYWVREYGIDGWRLDVADEINDSFWRSFRKRVKAVKEDCALIGEVWESAGHWLDGTMFDSTMNYEFRNNCRAFFAEREIDAEQFNGCVTNMLMRYRGNIAQAQMNLLDSHDVSRFLSLCGGDLRKMKLALVFQMTFVGMPTIFYGDEQEMIGILEVEFRHPMNWNGQSELFGFIQKLISLRLAEPALRIGDFCCAEADGDFYHFCRSDEDKTVHVLLNNGPDDKPIRLHAEDAVLLAEGFEHDSLKPYGFIITETSAEQ